MEVLKSFDIQKTLNPLVWTNAGSDDFNTIDLTPVIRLKLLAIARMFMSSVKLANLKIEDIIFTGSLANYNWSEFSDVDLHVLVDKTKIDVDDEILGDYFTVKKSIFNTKHNITIKDFEVELYIQDVADPHAALGIYSILHDEWLKIPSKQDVTIDKANVKKKVKIFTNKIQEIGHMVKSDEEPQKILSMIELLKDKIKRYRRSGLSTNGEYSDENLVFKYLRRTEYLKKLSDYKLDITDKMFSLKEAQ